MSNEYDMPNSKQTVGAVRNKLVLQYIQLIYKKMYHWKYILIQKIYKNNWDKIRLLITDQLSNIDSIEIVRMIS